MVKYGIALLMVLGLGCAGSKPEPMGVVWQQARYCMQMIIKIRDSLEVIAVCTETWTTCLKAHKATAKYGSHAGIAKLTTCTPFRVLKRLKRE